MAEYDGSIRIGVLMDKAKVEKQLAELRATLTNQTREIDKQAKAASRLEAQLTKLSESSKIPAGASEEFREYTAQMAAAQQEALELSERLSEAKQAMALEGSTTPEGQAEMDSMAERITLAEQRADELGRKLAELGIPYDAIEKALGLQQQIGAANSELERMQTEAQDTATRISELEGKTTGWPAKLGNLVSRMGKSMASAGGKAVSVFGKLRDRIKGLGREKGFEKASKSAGRFANSLKSLVSGALFFNLISRGLTALTKQMGAYLTANRQFSDALSGVKSNLLTAFQPIYDAVMPALTKLMEGMELVTAKIAAFMATIFGTTAQAAQENAKALNEQADATKEAGQEAKKAGKWLASFDTIEKVAAENTEDSKAEDEEEDSGFDTDFSNIQPPKWLMDFWKVFQDSWAQYGNPTVEAFKNAWAAIKGLVLNLGAAFMAVWTGGDGLAALNAFQLMLQNLLGVVYDVASTFALAWQSPGGQARISLLLGLLTTMLGIISDIASAFRSAWQNGGGEAVVSALSSALSSILSLLISIGQSFRDAWNGGIGVEICQTILSIITKISDIVGNLASKLKEAWEANGNGKAIWEDILLIIQDVLDAFDEMAAAALDWASTLNLEPIVAAFRDLMDAVEPVVDAIADGLAWAYENILLPLASWVIEDAAPASIQAFAKVLDGILPILKAVIDWFKSMWPIIQPVAKFIGGVLVGAIQRLGDVLQFVGNIVAWFIELVTKLISAVTGASTSASSLGNTASGKAGTRAISDYGTKIFEAPLDLTQYPHLASGAVISPNNEFLAVLGDQRNGRNLEAPEGLIRQIMREELGNIAGGLGQTNVRVEFSGSLAQLARVLQPHITTETARLGPQLISGGGLA